MSGVNRVILIGHLGKDPEVRHLDGGVNVASFPLATSETYVKDGRKVEQTEWHNIVMWRSLADVAAKYLQKGKLVFIEGKLRTRSFEDREGNKKSTTEIVAENFTMLGRKSDFEPSHGTANNGHQNHTGNSTPVQPTVKEEQPMDFSGNNPDDDLPF
jgi:single-strand DNA-binding protein